MLPFGDKVKRLRNEKGWSQDALAEQIGIHGRHVGKYEKGKAMPNAETAVKIENFFDVSTDYLLIEDAHIIESTKIRDKEWA